MTSIFDIINVPFGYLLKFFYSITNNYALTLLMFAIVIKIVLLPFGISQQKNSVRMAKMKPKDAAIRKKYAGRNDQATQQKMQAEIMELYKQEHYSPLSSCLPLLIQLPIIMALYNIVRSPLTYITRWSAELLNGADGIKQFILDTFKTTEPLLEKITDIKIMDELLLVRLFNNSTILDAVKEKFSDIPDVVNFVNIDFTIFGGAVDLAIRPLDNLLSLLLIIPLLNGALSFLQTRLNKKLNPAMADPAASGGSMKMLEYSMPLLIVYMSFTFNAAIGMYWIFQTVIALVQMIVLAKLMPLPRFTEEELKAAEKQYGGTYKEPKQAKENKTRPKSIYGLDDDDEGEDEAVSVKQLPNGINPSAKNSGKKYTIKKRK